MTFLDHLPILPVLLPAMTAVVLLLIGDGAAQRGWIRGLACASVLLGAGLALMCVQQAANGSLLVYRLGNWPAPFGIVLVIDRLAALMLLLSSAIALPVLWYACQGWDERGRHFHAIVQFQLMGLMGAFVTGDLFNLFVFFEVLLVASYVLMTHGLGGQRLRAGLHYVVLNLVASSLFLVGVALLYAFTGTLNLADLALRVPQVQDGEGTVIRAAGLILLVVFGFKAALVPLAMWLPATYAATSAPVAALFALMTKVGVYALWRVHGVVYGADGLPPVLLPLAVATSLLGALGALAATDLSRLVAWLTVASVGTILMALGLHDAGAWSAGLFYLLNSTVVMAGLFLLSEKIARQRGRALDRLEPGPAMAQPALLGLLLLIAVASAAGLPPLPGFLGKLMLLQASRALPQAAWVWLSVLVVGVVVLLALARAGSVLFWASQARSSAAAPAASPHRLLAVGTLLAMSALLSIFAAPVQRYTLATAMQLQDRHAYATAVLAGAAADAVRPYRGRPAGPSSRP